MLELDIHQQRQLPECGLAELVRESQATGFPFVQRLVDQWQSRANRFEQPGEAFFTAMAGSRVVGVGGLNRDPYTTAANVGRIRHLYVLAQFRRAGVGRRLVAEIVRAAPLHFNRLRLRTNTAAGAHFYLALGFQPVLGVSDCTHELFLNSQQALTISSQ